MVKQLSFGPNIFQTQTKSANIKLPYVESVRGSSQDAVNSPKFGGSTANESSGSLPNVVDASSSGSNQRQPTKKQKARSAFYG